MIIAVEADVESAQGSGAVVRTAHIAEHGRRRFFVDMGDVRVAAGDRVGLDVDLDAGTARLVRVMGNAS
jgi:hypothetical protein